jgi:subtilisin family serine protease
MRRFITLRQILSLILFLFLIANISQAQEKKKAARLDDLPRYTYHTDLKASELLLSDNEFMTITKEVKSNILKTLDTYIVEDKTTLGQYYDVLGDIELLEGNYDSASEYFDKAGSLKEKPAEKLMSGIINKPLAEALKKNDGDKEKARDDFRKELKARVDKLPWDTVQDNIEQIKGTYEILSKNVVVGMVQTQFDPGVEKTGNLSGDAASQIIGTRVFLDYFLPYKEDVVEIFGNYIDANKVDKPDIWADRNVDLSNAQGLSKVMVGIWDSGVDTGVFNDRIFTNPNEKPDGIDNDNNGFTDDVNGIAFSVQEDYTPELMYPMSQAELENYPRMKSQVKGLMDLQAAVNSPESVEIKKTISSLKPEDIQAFLEELSLFSMYVHGTHVAGIAVDGNPYADVLVARISFDHRAIPEPPTIEKAEKAANNYRSTVKYFQDNKVRVVNMSWGWTLKEIEGMLEANGIGKDAEERAKMTRSIFDIYKDGLYDAIKSAPEILFVTAAGNSDNDVTFDEVIPSFFDLPNLITAGAVDQAGEETGFTSFGESVDVHANGFEVESFLPGGEKIELSGTSMASPNVANLAAKLFALDESLTPEEVKRFIIEGAEKKSDGRITLINPRKSVELLKEE